MIHLSQRMTESIQLINVFIEGAIATGKSTLAKELQARLSTIPGVLLVDFFPEIIDSQLLERFNKNPKAYEVLFQNQMIINRAMKRVIAKEKTDAFAQDYLNKDNVRTLLTTNAQEKKIINLFDTGYLSDKAFILANRNSQYITEDTYKHLLKTERLSNCTIGSKLGLLPTHIILLEASEDVCLRNIKQRSRPSEHQITKEYLSDLKGAYNVHVHDAIEAGFRILIMPVTGKEYAKPDDAIGFILQD